MTPKNGRDSAGSIDNTTAARKKAAAFRAEIDGGDSPRESCHESGGIPVVFRLKRHANESGKSEKSSWRRHVASTKDGR